jgi:ribonuclease P protein component
MGSQPFSAASRLRARAEYLAVQNQGRRVSGRYLTMLGRPNGLGRDRLGIIASRKVGGAVQRNRAKRRIREMFRTLGPANARSATSPLDLVVIARPDIVTAPFAAVTADFQAALGKLRGAR